MRSKRNNSALIIRLRIMTLDQKKKKSHACTKCVQWG